MGERKCAYEGCNALEFRTSGYCLRHKNGNPSEKTSSAPDAKVSPITGPVQVSWWWVVTSAYLLVPIILYWNVITHEEPGGAIAPTGFLNIPCFVLSLVPLLAVAYVKYTSSEHWLKRYRR